MIIDIAPAPSHIARPRVFRLYFVSTNFIFIRSIIDLTSHDTTRDRLRRNRCFIAMPIIRRGHTKTRALTQRHSVAASLFSSSCPPLLPPSVSFVIYRYIYIRNVVSSFPPSLPPLPYHTSNVAPFSQYCPLCLSNNSIKALTYIK